jgi:hypothetical protein
MRLPIDLIMNNEDQPTVIDDDSVTKFDSLWQTKHDKPDDSRNANDFWNELSSKFESSEQVMLINTNDDIKTTSDSLEASDDGKSDDWCYVNDSVNEVSAKPKNDEKSVLTLIHDDITVCSDKESSFENQEQNSEAAKPAEMDWLGRNSCPKLIPMNEN